jgi:predicted AAA+ superfamily ATPase
MFRSQTALLDRWLLDPRRRPLVLRGARQVGKTWLVRELAARSGRELVELNFERDPTLAAACWFS